MALTHLTLRREPSLIEHINTKQFTGYPPMGVLFCIFTCYNGLNRGPPQSPWDQPVSPKPNPNQILFRIDFFRSTDRWIALFHVAASDTIADVVLRVLGPHFQRPWIHNCDKALSLRKPPGSLEVTSAVPLQKARSCFPLSHIRTASYNA